MAETQMTTYPMHYFQHHTNVYVLASIIKLMLNFVYIPLAKSSVPQFYYISIYNILFFENGFTFPVTDERIYQKIFVDELVDIFKQLSQELRHFFINARKENRTKHPQVLFRFLLDLENVKSLDEVMNIFENHDLFLFASRLKIIETDKLFSKISFKESIPNLKKIFFNLKFDKMNTSALSVHAQPFKFITDLSHRKHLFNLKSNFDKLQKLYDKRNRFYDTSNLKQYAIDLCAYVENDCNLVMEYWIGPGFRQILHSHLRPSYRLSHMDLTRITLDILWFLALAEKDGLYHGAISKNVILAKMDNRTGQFTGAIVGFSIEPHKAHYDYPWVPGSDKTESIFSKSIAEDLIILKKVLMELDEFCECEVIQRLDEFGSAIDALKKLKL